MLQTVFDLPLHPLVVHVPLVLVPLAAVLAIVIAVSQERRTRWGALTWLLTTLALAGVVVAKLSGDTLAASEYGDVLPVPAADHADYGLMSVWFTLALWLAVTALMLIDVDRRRRHGYGSALLSTVVAVAAIVTAMAATGQVLLTGWTGTENQWTSTEG